MSDVTVTPEAPAIALDPSTPAASAPAPAPVPAGEPEAKPSWLDARLERERRAVLKELGFDNVESGKKAAATAKAAEDAEKTTAQKAAEAEARDKSKGEKIQELESALSVLAKDQMSALTEVQRNAVVEVAGDDAAKQIKTISALKSTWTGAAAPAATTPPPAVQDTAPGRTAPKAEGGTSTPQDPKAIHAELKKSNPIFAARYALENGIFE